MPDSPSGAVSPTPATGAPSAGHGGLAPWPGPAPADLADGSLVVSATSPRAGVVVARAIGEIDLLTAPGWRWVLAAAVRMLGSGSARGSRLVCDLSPVTFLGASGLDVLVDLAEQCGQAGVDLRVVAGNRRVSRVLRLSTLDRHLAVDDRIERAVG